MKKGEYRQMKTRLDEQQHEIEQLRRERDRASEQWREEAQKNSMRIGEEAEKLKLQKKLDIIEHITAGRKDEAIQELLRPMPFLFTLDVRFSDGAHDAYEEEVLGKVKKLIAASIEQVQIKRDEEEEKAA